MGWGRRLAAAFVVATLSACTGQAGPVVSSASSRSALPATSESASTSVSPAAPQLTELQALDASFVTDNRGFVLGRARCAGGACVVLLGTTDGARHWTQLSRLPVAPYDGDGNCRVEARCVRYVRFATPLIGYAFGPAVYMTVDGGRTWRKQGGGWTFSLEAGPTSVLRVSSSDTGCDGQPSRLESSRPGSSTWTLVRSLPTERHCTPTLYRQGEQALALVDYGNPAGSIPQAVTVTSHDGGRHVGETAGKGDICYGDTGHTASAAVAPGDVLVQLCVGNAATKRQYDNWLRISTDLGRTYQPAQQLHRSDPSYPVPSVIAASSATHLLALADGPHVGVLQVTFDGGRHWKMTGEMPPGLRTLLGFEDDSTARAIVGNDVFTTTDGGRTWRDDKLAP